MWLWDLFKSKVDRDAAHLVFHLIDPERVVGAKPRPDAARPISSPPRAIAAGKHYVRVRLAEMFLDKEVIAGVAQHPALHSVIRFTFATQTVEVPNLIDPRKLNPVAQKGSGVLIVRDVALTPPVPFNGGLIGISAGLMAVEGDNYAKNFISSLGDLASQMVVTAQLSSVLNVALPLVNGIQALLGAGANHPHLAFYREFAAGELKEGYIALLRATAAQVSPKDLWVVDGVLCEASGGAKARLDRCDYMLLRVEVFEERDDWQHFPTINKAYEEVQAELSAQRADEAAKRMTALFLLVKLTPEFTEADKKRVIEKLTLRYKHDKDELVFKGLDAAEKFTLEGLMKGSAADEDGQAPSIESLLERLAVPGDPG